MSLNAERDQNVNNNEESKERRLSNVANSVAGFYREPNMSEHSIMRSTHESNFA